MIVIEARRAAGTRVLRMPTNARFRGEVEWKVRKCYQRKAAYGLPRPVAAVCGAEVSGMDDNDSELILQICTKAGMMMEDTSALALDISGFAPERRGATIQALTTATDVISSLLQAAAILSAWATRADRTVP